MIKFLPILMSLVLEMIKRHERPRRSLMLLGIGWALIALAVLFGGYFLFQYLVSVIGYFETAGVLCLVLGIAGVFCLIFRPKKQPSTLHTFFEEAKESVTKTDIPHFLSKHSDKIILGSVLCAAVLGAFLSQSTKRKKK